MRTNPIPAGWAVAVLGSALLAGCGAVTPGHALVPGGPNKAGGTSAMSGPGGRSCPARSRLRAGTVISGWRLGAIDFLSGSLGVALTAPQIPCTMPLGPGQGRQIREQLQPVRLAVTSDGGRHWATRGGRLPATRQSDVTEQVVATSAQDAWALSNTGTLQLTHNAGATWTVQPLPRPVVALAGSAGPRAAGSPALWALSCSPAVQAACVPVLDRKLLPDGSWRRLPVPALASAREPRLAVLSANTVVLLVTRAGNGRPLLVSSADGGQRWSIRPSPPGPRHLCSSDASITAISADNWWLLCAGGFAAGSSTKALLHTTGWPWSIPPR